MKGLIFVYSSLAFICVAAIIRPWIGVVGYFGFVALDPTYLWRYSLPQDQQYQKFIAAATFLGLIILGFKGNRIKGAPGWAMLSLILYLLWAWVTAQFTVSQSATAFYMSYIWKMILMVCIGILLIDTPKKVLTLMWVLVIAQGWNAWEINNQYFQDGYSYAAYYGWGSGLDNNMYSISTIPYMGMSLGLAFYSVSIWARGLAGLIFVLQMHEIMLLQSRGTMIGALVLAGLGVWYVHKNKWTVSTILAAFVMGILLAGPSVVEEFTSAFAEEGERDSSADSRFQLWKAGMAMTMDHPVLGVGPGAAETLVPRYYEGGLNTGSKALHNLYFEVSCGSGLPGLILYGGYFTILWISIRKFWKRNKLLNTPVQNAASFAVLCGLPGYAVASMFSASPLMEASYILMVISATLQLVTFREQNQIRFHNQSGRFVNSLASS